MDWTDFTIRVPTQSARASVATTRTFGVSARGLQFKANLLSDASTNLPCLALTAQNQSKHSALRRRLLCSSG